MRKTLEKELAAALKAKLPENTDAHKEQMLESIRQMQALKQRGRKIGFIRFLLRQVPFVAKKLWAMQGLMAMAVFVVLYSTLDGDLGYLGIRHIPALLGGLAVSQIMLAIPFMQRSFQYRMYEIEASTRLSYTSLIMANMILMAAGSMAVFSICAVVTSIGLKLPGMDMMLYFLLPFLVAGSGCFWILNGIRRSGNQDVGTGICEGYCAGLMAALLLLAKAMPQVYETMAAWRIAMLIMLPASAVSVYWFIRQSSPERSAYEIRNL